ncbi:MAG: NAD(P)H-hydrate dehydratase [bacterium]
MIPLYNNQQIREADNIAINELGFPGSILMENASLNCYRIICDNYFGCENTIGIVCGKGNNGGDGFAIARHFAVNGFGIDVLVISSEDDLKGDSLLNYNILKNISLKNHNAKIKFYKNHNDLNILNKCSIIVDAILGSGSNGILIEPIKSIVEYLNKLDSYKVAIDIPTGLNINTGYGEIVFNSDLTICLAELKAGLFYGCGSQYAGKIIKGDIGLDKKHFEQYIPKEYLIEPEDAVDGLPYRSKTIHKYSGGKVLVIAGSDKYPGAAYLCANSSLITGAGATTLAIPESIKPLVFQKLLESVVITYSESGEGYFTSDALDKISDVINKSDVIAIGCGLGREEKTIEAIEKLLTVYNKKNIVFDADAIFCISKIGLNKFNLINKIFTPHLAEFAALINVPLEEVKLDILKYGRNFVKNTKAYLVLKGSPTIIFNPKDEVFINTTGNNGMAKFGTGDVLTGVVASFIAQSMNIERSLISAVYLHSLSADLLLNTKTEYGITAGDILQNLPNSIKFLRDSIV